MKNVANFSNSLVKKFSIFRGTLNHLPSIENSKKIIEIIAFIAAIVSAKVAYDEHLDNIRKEQAALAEKVYRDVDERYVDFIKLCIEHPRLDCYSAPRKDRLKPPLSEDEKYQQKLLFVALTDVFEVAYVQYFKTTAIPEELRVEFHEKQWPGWEVYIKKFMSRTSYRKVWIDIREEYDSDFVGYIEKLNETLVSDKG